jgi:hypothetical protein
LVLGIKLNQQTRADNDNRYFAPAIKQILTAIGVREEKLGARVYSRQCQTAAQVPSAARPAKRGGPAKAASGFTWLSFPPEPFGMRLAPVRMTLLVLADQDAEADAGFPIAFIAKLVESEHFRLYVTLGACGRCDHR